MERVDQSKQIPAITAITAASVFNCVELGLANPLPISLSSLAARGNSQSLRKNM
jgi:hypothetical protein